MVTIPAVVDGQTIAWVAAGRSLETEDRLLHQVRLLLVAGGAVAIVVSLGAGWWLAGRAVRPVERAYRAQAGFAADASHELRTPLAFIRSGSRCSPRRDPDLGRDVLSDVDYLTGLTQRLLQMARAEGGVVALERAPIDVGAAVPVGGPSQRDRARGPPDPRRPGGGDRARRSRGAGGRAGRRARERASARRRRGRAHLDPGHGRAEIAVADHGPGMPNELADRAFERFFRADPSRARETGGAGLGLSLARSLVEAQGGRMWLEATPGGGLTAKIDLPLAST